MNRTQQKFKFFTDLNEDKIEKKNNQQMSLVAYPNFFKKKNVPTLPTQNVPS